MGHKIVGVSHSNNSTIKVYIKNQLDAIKEYNSSLAIEEGDESYSAIETNVSPEQRNRFPMLFYIKKSFLYKKQCYYNGLLYKKGSFIKKWVFI